MMSWRERYRRWFAIEEIESSQALRMMFFALMVGFFYGLQDMFYRDAASFPWGAGYLPPLCPDYFQSCHGYAFLPSRYVSWVPSIFYTTLFAGLGGAIACGLTNRWTAAHALVLPAFFAKLVLNFGYTANLAVPYETDHLFPCAVFLFAHRKLDGLRLLLVVLYVLSGVVKLDEAWVAGTYFSTLRLGLPLFPDALTPLVTNFVVCLQLAGSWALLSHRPRPQRGVFLVLITFHVYSCLFVGFRYPMQFLPLLAILFHAPVARPRPRATTWGLLSLLLAMNLFPYTIDGNHRLTFEGRSLALDMFDANRQALSVETLHRRDGTTVISKAAASNALERINPYTVLAKLQRWCQDPATVRIAWRMVVSHNGGPFRVLVDEANACALEYRYGHHNSWLRLDGEVVGHPEKNDYYGPRGMGAEPGIYPAPTFTPSALTAWFQRHWRTIAVLHGLAALLAMGGVLRRRL